MDAFEAISLPESTALHTKKHFTLEEATRALVLVRRIVADLVHCYRQLRELHETYHTMEHAEEGTLTEADRTRIEATRRQYASLADRLTDLREELEAIGCELKDFDTGLIDFPGLRDGREVLLCWKLGEPTIAHWHEVDAGFPGRKPIDPVIE